MSIILGLKAAPDPDLGRLLETPAGITEYLFGAEAASPPPRPGLLARLFGGSNPAAAPPVPAPPGPGAEIDLDKAWQGLHFLFTGKAEGGAPPASVLTEGGREIGDVDVGYGPARAVRSDEVAAFAAFLDTLGPEELRSRYDPARMAKLGVYPNIWGPPEEREKNWEYLAASFSALKTFVDDARREGMGIILYFA